MSDKAKLKRIVPASLFARTFGAVIDLAITLFIGAGLAIAAVNIARSTPSVNNHKENYISEMTDSKIITYNQKTNLVSPVIKDDYKDYEALFYEFYSSFMPSKKEYKYTHDTYWYNVHIYGLKDEKGLYSQDDLKENVLSISRHIGPTLFTYKLDADSNKLLDEFALPIAKENDEEKVISSEENKKLLSFYYLSDEESKNSDIAKEYKYIYFYALSELTSITSIVKEFNAYNIYGMTISISVALIFSMFIFYFVIPLIFKNGESLGKLIMHTCLVNKLGYAYNKLGLIIRFLIPALLVGIVLVFMGLSLISLLILSGIILISYLMVIFTKDHKAIHDYLSGSLVIDKKESTFFKDATEEERFEQQAAKFDSLLKEDKDVSEDKSILYVNPRYREKDDKEEE